MKNKIYFFIIDGLHVAELPGAIGQPGGWDDRSIIELEIVGDSQTCKVYCKTIVALFVALGER